MSSACVYSFDRRVGSCPAPAKASKALATSSGGCWFDVHRQEARWYCRLYLCGTDITAVTRTRCVRIVSKDSGSHVAAITRLLIVLLAQQKVGGKCYKQYDSRRREKGERREAYTQTDSSRTGRQAYTPRTSYLTAAGYGCSMSAAVYLDSTHIRVRAVVRTAHFRRPKCW